jgi:hypothetical protein
MALFKATNEVIWICKFLYELGFFQIAPTIIYSNNQSAIALTTNPKFHSRIKYIDVQYHFTCDQFLTKQIILPYVPTIEITVDILTKSRLQNKHISCMDALGMFSYPSTPKQTFFPIKTFMVWAPKLPH